MKGTEDTPLLNRLARRVGRAAGLIASATHNLPSNKSSASPLNQTPTKSARAKRKSASKKKASKKPNSVKPPAKKPHQKPKIKAKSRA
jgi:hypothetical protein